MQLRMIGRPLAHDASAQSTVICSDVGDAPRWLLPHGNKFVAAGDYAAILRR
jgi:hypothetical protein